jgi:hypothetical protein
MNNEVTTSPRSLAQISCEIADSLGESIILPKYGYMRPYIYAMAQLDSISEQCCCDSALDIVLRFLCNANTWQGEDARRIKAELKSIVKSTGYKL